jgi:hypothetical protein
MTWSKFYEASLSAGGTSGTPTYVPIPETSVDLEGDLEIIVGCSSPDSKPTWRTGIWFRQDAVVDLASGPILEEYLVTILTKTCVIERYTFIRLEAGFRRYKVKFKTPFWYRHMNIIAWKRARTEGPFIDDGSIDFTILQ